MTITRKEKVLIFVLILFLLVGGTFTLGIMPKMDEAKELQAQIAEKDAEIKEAQDAANSKSRALFNKLKAQIERDRIELDAITAPDNNIYEESMSIDADGYADRNEASNTMNNLLSKYGIILPGKVSAVVSNPPTGATIYKITSNYVCKNMEVMFNFVDDMAKVKSYNVSSLSYQIAENGMVEGTITFSVILLGK